MGQLARAQVSQANEAFARRNVALAQKLVGLDGEIHVPPSPRGFDFAQSRAPGCRGLHYRFHCPAASRCAIA